MRRSRTKPKIILAAAAAAAALEEGRELITEQRQLLAMKDLRIAKLEQENARLRGLVIFP